jgi:hypothetical protein
MPNSFATPDGLITVPYSKHLVNFSDFLSAALAILPWSSSSSLGVFESHISKLTSYRYDLQRRGRPGPWT